MDIFAAAQVPIEYEFHNFSLENVQPGGDLISPEALDSIRRNKVALKGNLFNTKPKRIKFVKAHSQPLLVKAIDQ